MLDLSKIPNFLYNYETNVKEWKKQEEKSYAGGFQENKLLNVYKLSLLWELETQIRITLFFWMFGIPIILLIICVKQYGISGIIVTLIIIFLLNKIPHYKNIKCYQQVKTERRNQQQFSIKFVQPEELQNLEKPVIFCIAPHGVSAQCCHAWPFFSKLFGNRTNRLVGAPVIFQIPILRQIFKSLGVIKAYKKEIKKVIENNQNVSIVLDGIKGVFQDDPLVEKCALLDRLGIIKIALTQGTPIIPVFGFGHNKVFKRLIDSYGLVKNFCIKLNINICPYQGRFQIPYGPPNRVPIVAAFGDLIDFPKIQNPTIDEIKKQHKLMLEGFVNVFNAHKKSYGQHNKVIEFV